MFYVANFFLSALFSLQHHHQRERKIYFAHLVDYYFIQKIKPFFLHCEKESRQNKPNDTNSRWLAFRSLHFHLSSSYLGQCEVQVE